MVTVTFVNGPNGNVALIQTTDETEVEIASAPYAQLTATPPVASYASDYLSKAQCAQLSAAMQSFLSVTPDIPNTVVTMGSYILNVIPIVGATPIVGTQSDGSGGIGIFISNIAPNSLFAVFIPTSLSMVSGVNGVSISPGEFASAFQYITTVAQSPVDPQIGVYNGVISTAIDGDIAISLPAVDGSFTGSAIFKNDSTGGSNIIFNAAGGSGDSIEGATEVGPGGAVMLTPVIDQSHNIHGWLVTAVGPVASSQTQAITNLPTGQGGVQLLKVLGVSATGTVTWTPSDNIQIYEVIVQKTGGAGNFFPCAGFHQNCQLPVVSIQAPSSALVVA